MKIAVPQNESGASVLIQTGITLSIKDGDEHNRIDSSSNNVSNVSKNINTTTPIKKASPVEKESNKEITKQPIKASVNTLSIAMELIKKYECGNGPHLKAYRDHLQWTIGCGTVSYKGEIITEKEAYRRFELEVKARLDVVQKDYPTYTQQQQAALASLRFNCPKCYNQLKRAGITATNFKSYVYAGGVVAGGLVKRRKHEWNVYLGNPM